MSQKKFSFRVEDLQRVAGGKGVEPRGPSHGTWGLYYPSKEKESLFFFGCGV